jgi:hypothetical protein
MTQTSRIFLMTILVASVLASAGCLPRGETKTLDEVYRQAKSEYLALNKSGLPQDLNEKIKGLEAQVIAFAEGDKDFNFEKSARDLSGLLSSVTPKAGYTSRASLAELSLQLQSFSQSATDEETRAKAKLIGARTLSLLKGEFDTTKFGL